MEEILYDGQLYKQALKLAEFQLEKRIDELNALNVFPVPDGDTGINMYLTIKAAAADVEDSTATSISEVSAKAARAALLGARGNSGVILSQILHGMAKTMEMKEHFTSIDFAQALRSASDMAYRSITKPVEGTILTVIREAADIAHKQAERGASLKQTIGAVTSQARDTVKKTPELLSQLKEAGVVDAGGKGLYYFFLGMKQYFSGKNSNSITRKKTAKVKAIQIERKYGFDLQFLIEGKKLPLMKLRKTLLGMGESVLVVGDEQLIRVHIHTKDTQSVLDYCNKQGLLRDVTQEDLDEQATRFSSKKTA
ncbi:MAG: DAK2 domain-containing protein [Dehalococcoidales bacterium]|nr:DAK2 domain-containing protein [Dehalococcoidales bacterium]